MVTGNGKDVSCNLMTFVTVGITNPLAEHGNVITKGLCAGLYMYFVGKVKRTNSHEGNLIL